MNLARPSLKVVSYVFQFWLALRRLLPKQTCQTFGMQGAQIEKIYVINLDRETIRWSNMQQELRRLLDSSGNHLLNLTDRYVAVDAKAFLGVPPENADIDPFYTLGDQLFVEPQPLVVPTKFELNTPIRMSRAEIAVARSHINVWRQIAASNHAYVMILEDDVWFHNGFAKHLDQVWEEVMGECDKSGTFDVLYLSYLEAKHGAPKVSISNTVFSPLRGLWHLSGYIVSREGAEKLLQMLPCRGPIDLWINHMFEALNVSAAKQPIVSQRRDVKSSNSYSILPTLTTIGAINSEAASLFNIRPIEHPVFTFGPEGSGHSSLAMALCMLGYKCCSDLEGLPAPELERLLDGREGRVFDAYVNIGSLGSNVRKLRSLYPKAKFIFTAAKGIASDDIFESITDELNGAHIAVLHTEEPNKWQVICEHLRCAPPTSSFPELEDLGQRPTPQGEMGKDQLPISKKPKWDKSPWVVESRKWWQGIRSAMKEDEMAGDVKLVSFTDCYETLDTKRWLLRNDTFTDNLALFRPSNFMIKPGVGAELFVRSEPLGVREYSAASICSRDQYLFGTFEATLQASNVPGVVTGFFLHRNSPRQEIDIEIAGNRPDRLMVNVFYNPGGEGANFDYGYRGAPSYIDLGFDASKASHRFTIEWTPCEILWKVDGHLVHRRVMWDPTPIPHLPMTLHVNSWPTRSTQLAGRINKRRLPGAAILESIVIKANSVTSTPVSNADDMLQTKAKILHDGLATL
ncbi:family 16 glycosylhydrolase [Zhongshania aquimaris]|jgi:GR25 family glycosyltransferase involved in LPS biosynthesis|uniref:Beta-glucanase n=1 Tax=Zhongshania aquimaris TaxID=2857107 RepID=A0ABS6VLG4_9GAMM|nr:family 16 glycosylhydrolase [Zhongshania aquimaris]MBW2939147.1 family 16 glycosylhydrolase [Zhongshania aquimaris]